MNRYKVLVLGALCLPFVAEAAELPPPAFEITIFGGYRYGGEFETIPPEDNPATGIDESAVGGRSLDLKDTPFVGITLNFEQTEDAYYEFTYSRQETELEGENFDLTVEYLHLGGIVQWSDGDKDHVVPFFGMTVGGTRFTPGNDDLDDETNFSLGVAGGIKFPITRHFGLRLEGRGYFTFLDSSSSVFCASIGGAGSCAIRVSGSSFFQAQGLLGVTASF
jgi:opacity protein-like surface antigen